MLETLCILHGGRHCQIALQKNKACALHYVVNLPSVKVDFLKSPAENAWMPPHTNSHGGATCQTTLVFPIGSSTHQAPVSRPGSEICDTQSSSRDKAQSWYLAPGSGFASCVSAGRVTSWQRTLLSPAETLLAPGTSCFCELLVSPALVNGSLA